jgi:hypothetical protein
MTEPAERDTDTLYVTDAELIRRLGVPEKIAYARLRYLDTNPRLGFPPKQEFWGHRRYWPAVKAYFDRCSGLIMAGSQPSREVSRDRKSA